MKEMHGDVIRVGEWTLRALMTDGALQLLCFVEVGLPESSLSSDLLQLKHQLREYFAGRRKRFDVSLHLVGTPFQQEVWLALQEIPFGETRSYKQIAARIGRPLAFRAVGQALHRNPVAIIVPCHRVIGSSGSLTGFAGGTELKRQLLALESRVMAQR